MPISQWHREGALKRNYSFLSMDTKFGSEGGAYNGISNRKKKDNSRKFSTKFQHYVSVLKLSTIF